MAKSTRRSAEQSLLALIGAALLLFGVVAVLVWARLRVRTTFHGRVSAVGELDRAPAVKERLKLLPRGVSSLAYMVNRAGSTVHVDFDIAEGPIAEWVREQGFTVEPIQGVRYVTPCTGSRMKQSVHAVPVSNGWVSHSVEVVGDRKAPSRKVLAEMVSVTYDSVRQRCFYRYAKRKLPREWLSGQRRGPSAFTPDSSGVHPPVL